MSLATLAQAASATLAVLALAACAPPPGRARQAIGPTRPRPGRARAARRAAGVTPVAVAVAVVAIVAIVAIVIAAGIAAALAIAALACGAAASRRRRRRIAHQRAVRSAYPHALDVLALTMRAGFTTAGAARLLATSGPPAIRPAFAAVCRRIDRGDRVATAVEALGVTIGPVAAPLVRALADCERSGLPLAPVLDRLDDEARNQRRRDAEAAARRLPVRLAFPLTVCMLPSFVLLAVVPLLAAAFSELRVLDA